MADRAETLMSLTKSTQRTFQFIKTYIQEHQIAPTEAEIAEGIGIKSRGVVHRYVHALAEAGLLGVIPGRKRNIRLAQSIQQPHGIPLEGLIAAGKPIETYADRDIIDIASLFVGNQRYALKVRGDSMIEEGIFDGDIVICEHTQQARNGDIVVALIDDDQATLKRFQLNTDDTVTLFPANSTMPPMIYPTNRVKIQGRYVGLIRV